MTTSDAQMIARALQEALNGAALKSLRVAAEAVRGGASSADSVNAVLGADAPREVRNVVATLAAAGRLNSIEAVVKAFESATSRGNQVLEATVTSAVALSDDASNNDRGSPWQIWPRSRGSLCRRRVTDWWLDCTGR